MIGDNAVIDEENITDDEDITDVDELLVEEVSIDGMCGVY
jgi:mycofactocin precursor